jgi:predicted heme/steroid binding protein
MPNTQYNRLDDNGLLYLLTLLKPVIDAAGEDNVIEVIQKNGVALTVSNKTVNIPVPTDAEIQTLIEAYEYQTAQDVDDAITEALAGITGIDFTVVQTLPQTGEKGVIYLVSNSGTGLDIYDEYIWVDGTPSGSFEKIGTTAVDLSGYVQASEMHALTNAEIDTIFLQVFGS